MHYCKWTSKLAYVADISDYVNIMYPFVQIEVTSTFGVQEKLRATMSELVLWCKLLSRGKLYFFPFLHHIVVKLGEDLEANVLRTIRDNFEALKIRLCKYIRETDGILN
jgi:hypothetical protein